jgi:hypothetical protein
VPSLPARDGANIVSQVLDRMEKAIRNVAVGRLKAGQPQKSALLLRTTQGTDWADMPDERERFRQRIRQLAGQPEILGVAIVTQGDPTPDDGRLLYAVIVDRATMASRTVAWTYAINKQVSAGPGRHELITEVPADTVAKRFGPFPDDLTAELAGGRVA